MAFNVIKTTDVDSKLTILALKTLQELMNQCMMPRLVSVRQDVEGKVRGKGDTIRVLIPASLAVNPKSEDEEYTFQGLTDDNVEVVLDQHNEASFRVSGPAQMFSSADTIAMYAKNAALALAAQVDTDLLALYLSAGGSVGTYGTPLDAAAMLALRKAFSDAQVSASERNLVLGTQGINDLLVVSDFTRAERIGTAQALREGVVGRIFGIDVWEDPRVPISDKTTDEHHNLAFQRDCIVLGVAPMFIPPAGSGVDAALVAVTDESGQPTGVQLRVMFWFDPNENTHKCVSDILYGVKVIRAAGVFEVKR